ncbi:uncharacterized protein LOC110463139 [Mizuhopecten yessoensis]|uniref:uncharacterized protein LOC110463139 n=1 Tax=Mizuhopecten yessoensis TaxID=6573 RepID=UPI000B45BA82|nr:uncharacterized protein LOC110463139 [Mizuhopecten yessoensis]XP_021373183.1 uncharacterized protein LOC110463139 [Mizuhopecten yessoensis]
MSQSKPSLKNQKWKKAQFKLAAVTGVHRRKPPTRLSGTAKSSLGTAGLHGPGSQMFRDTASIHTSGSNIVREMYQPKFGYNTKTMQRFMEYLKKTDLESVFQVLLTILLNRNELPYNPYPGFAEKIYPYVEKFHLYQISEEKIQHMLRNSLKETRVAHLFTVRNIEMVWGLSSVLRVVSAQRLIRYKWLVDDLIIDPKKLTLEEGYTADVIISLVGPCVFEGTFFSTAHHLQIRKEYVLYGEDSTKGVAEFVQIVEVEINEMYTSKQHQILGVNMLVSDVEGTGEHQEFWEPDRITQEQEIFEKQMTDTVQSNKFIKMECVFLLDPNYPKYIRGQIQYGLNFITINEKKGEELVTSFCEFPMATLHEGVFLKLSHGEAYMALYMPWLAVHQKENKERDDLFYISGKHLGEEEEEEYVLEDLEIDSAREHVFDRFDPIKPRRVKIDGFGGMRETQDSPYASNIITPLRSMLEMRAATESVKIATTLDACYTSILLLLLKNRNDNDKKLEMEIYRLMHGTAGRVYDLMEQNKSVRYIIKGFSNTKEVGVIREHLVTYRDAIMNLFDSSLNVRSSEYITVGRAMAAQVDDMIPEKSDVFATVPHIEMALQRLSSLNWYCQALFIQVVGDTLPELPVLQSYLENLRLESSNKGAAATRLRERPDALGKNFDLSDVIHGQESERIQNHERYVIDVAANMVENLTVSKLIAKDSVLLKYVVDTHLDMVWYDLYFNMNCFSTLWILT